MEADPTPRVNNVVGQNTTEANAILFKVSLAHFEFIEARFEALVNVDRVQPVFIEILVIPFKGVNSESYPVSDPTEVSPADKASCHTLTKSMV